MSLGTLHKLPAPFGGQSIKQKAKQMINQMNFETTSRVILQSMIESAVRAGLTFEAHENNGVYTIVYTGGF